MTPDEADLRPSSPASDATGQRLQTLLDRLVSRKALGHAVLGVGLSDEPMRWSVAAGEARPGVPMRPKTPYFIASVTKLFIAATILQLHEHGEVKLDAPLLTYLPEEEVGGIHRSKHGDLTHEITIRHLLSHTSGLPDFLEDRPKGGRSLYKRIADGEDVGWDFGEVVRIARDDLDPHFPPQDLRAERQKARYSDTGFQLLIAVIEAVTGRPFHEVLEERYFRPLSMRHTYLPGHSEPLEPVDEPAAVYRKREALDIPLAMASFNDLVSTAADTLVFMRALCRGELFEDPGTYVLMQERWNRIGYPLRYGLGMMKFSIPRPFGPGRAAVTLIGHSGGTGSWLFHCPEVDVFLTGTVDEVGSRAAPYRLVPAALRAIIS